MSSNKRARGAGGGPVAESVAADALEPISAMEAVAAVADIIARMETEDIPDVIEYVKRVHRERAGAGGGEEEGGSEEDMMQLEAIRTWLREQVQMKNKAVAGEDLSGVIPSEKLVNAPTVTADAFLYGDEEVAALRQSGHVPLGRCRACGGTDIDETVVMTHSLSVEEAKEIFLHVLPDLENRVVVDVGSRLGAVLFVGSVFSKAKKLIGIEMNPEWCALQTKAIELFDVKRVEVICSDVRKQGAVLQGANVVILHNVFEHFFEPKEAFELWQFIRDNLTKGTLIVASPALNSQFAKIDHVDTEAFLREWVEQIEVTFDVEEGEDDMELFLYRTLC